VSNALKYAGGEIRLSAQIPAGAPGEVEFSVADRGDGISEAGQATLFTKFTRLNRTGPHRIPGTGLGLASCRLLADIMGGAVGVVSRHGEGARFHLRLPLTPAAAPVESTVAQLPNTTVLLVEDTDYNAWAASAVLARLGLSCERARSGAEALALFAANRYNVVLLDRNLPDMDGTEVARRMREIEADTTRSLLLAVTAYCTAEDRALCLDAGMDAFVGKPLTPEKLRKALLDAGRQMVATPTADVAIAAAGAGCPGAAPAAADATPAGGSDGEIARAAQLDLSVLSYLAGDGEGALPAQIERFLADLDHTQEALTQTRATRDYAAMAAKAHYLLSQARMIGRTSLVAAASHLESAAKRRDASLCDRLLSRVGIELADVREVLRHRPRLAEHSM
jgi:CheY-like chemotaxis protein/HPt (histidine-containing phosphotransfer) domain-containing protein